MVVAEGFGVESVQFGDGFGAEVAGLGFGDHGVQHPFYF